MSSLMTIEVCESLTLATVVVETSDFDWIQLYRNCCVVGPIFLKFWLAEVLYGWAEKILNFGQLVAQKNNFGSFCCSCHRDFRF